MEKAGQNRAAFDRLPPVHRRAIENIAREIAARRLRGQEKEERDAAMMLQGYLVVLEDQSLISGGERVDLYREFRRTRPEAWIRQGAIA